VRYPVAIVDDGALPFVQDGDHSIVASRQPGVKGKREPILDGASLRVQGKLEHGP
jgi:hypothetical protein